MFNIKIIINPDSLVPDENWQYFHKVRAIIENDNGKIILSNEGGKCIFPGGKRDKSETNIDAIRREIKEETGIELGNSDFTEILELETFYENFYDFRSNMLRPRHTTTIYYYAKCSSKINSKNMSLTSDEVREGFNISFVSKEELIGQLLEDHSSAMNGSFFDEENRIIIENFFKELLPSNSMIKK